MGDAWIPVKQTLPDHRKTHLAAQLTAMDHHKFLGHLVQFWLWAIDHSTVEGSLPPLPYDVLGQRAGLSRRQSEGFIRALLEAGFLDAVDGRLRLHNWDEYGGRLIQRRETERDRMRRKRGSNVENLRQHPRNVAPTLFDGSQPEKRTEENRREEGTM